MLTKKPLASLVALALAGLCSQAQAAVTFGDTELTYGGYIKLDTMWTDTSDGQMATGVGRDFYVPGVIPVGKNRNYP